MNQTSIDSSGAGRGSFKSYTTGFILSIALTAIAFGLVIQSEALPRWVVFVTIFSAATVQILVHLHYFLHLDTSSKARWNILALMLTVLIMTLFVGGSLWIMFNLNHRMM